MRKNKEFVKFYAEDFYNAGLCETVKGVAFRLYTFLLSNMGEDNKIHFSRKLRAEFYASNVKRSYASESLNMLICLNLVARLGGNKFMINPLYATKTREKLEYKIFEEWSIQCKQKEKKIEKYIYF